jgi:hypothetical protein
MKMHELDEGHYNNYDNNRTGFSSQRRNPAEDESNLLYIFKDGRLHQAMISNHREHEARAQGFRDSPEQALKMHGIVKSKFHQGKWIKNEGGKWIEVHPFGKPEDVSESATAGATSAANVSVGPVYKNKPVKQPKNKDGTAKNALDMDANLMTGGSIKR